MGTRVKLTGGRVAFSAGQAERVDLGAEHGRFLSPGEAVAKADDVDVSDCLLLPGLINPHDHLEFSLFPRLGSGPYPNATAWAKDIYQPGASPVREQLLVPKEIRMAWGGLKNLLSGVTTVAHHNTFSSAVFTPAFPVRVLERYGWAHSLEFGLDVLESHRCTPPVAPFIIHAAEGTDAEAAREIRRLDELGLLDARLVVVHGVGATAEDVSLLAARGGSMIWCPSSNLFTLGRTLSLERLRAGLPVALGSDSPITSEGDLIDEIRVAREECGAGEEELFDMVTTSAAAVLRLREGQGSIREHGVADVVAVADPGGSPAAVLGRSLPEMVMIGGEIRLLSETFARRRPSLVSAGMQWVALEGRGRWLVHADVARLYAAAADVLGSGFRLAGRRVER